MSELRDLRRKRERLSVTVPSGLAAWVREMAQRNNVPVSSVVELALRRAQRANGAPDLEEQRQAILAQLREDADKPWGRL